MIYQDVYKRLEHKIIYKKKFYNLNPTEKESILRIAGVIANVVGYENIEIESRDCDIYFEDHDDYYLEVKTPQFFKGDRGDDLNRITKKFWDEIKSYRPNTLTGGLIKPNNKLEIVTRKLSGNSEIPKALLVMDSQFNPDKNVYRKLGSFLDKAAKQLERIEGGRRIVLIDITYLFKANLPTEKILFELVKDIDIMERVDGVSLFYHNQLLNPTEKLPYMIGPTIVNKQTYRQWTRSHKSKVFDHPHWGFIGNLIITTPNLIKPVPPGDVPKGGDFDLEKEDKHKLFEILAKFDQSDSEERESVKYRYFTQYYEKKYNLK